jgi:hypothetical protein
MAKPQSINSDPKTAVTKSVDAESGKTDDTPTSPPPIELGGEPSQPAFEPIEQYVKLTGIPKPQAFDLDEFKSTHSDGMPGVEIKPAALDIQKVGEVGDYFRVSPDEDKHWSDPLCFVTVPVEGVRQGTLHLITQRLADQFLKHKQVKRMRLVLATKPETGSFFLVECPCINMDNQYNRTAADGLVMCKTQWMMASTLRDDQTGNGRYHFEPSFHQDFVDKPVWLDQTINELVLITFEGRIIRDADHHALLRLRGMRLPIG